VIVNSSVSVQSNSNMFVCCVLFVIYTEKCPHLTDPEVFIIEVCRRAIYACRKNYINSGSYYLVYVNGKWNTSPPICEQVWCGAIDT